MPADVERYEIYYADKLWNLLPAIYRAEDTAELNKPGPLREMVNRIGAQAAILRRSIDRLWEDQSIETCDDWVIPYIADLLATNLVAGLDARGQRLDVANTIYYRRRKGTVGVLEEIAADITGWDARVVEFFRRMARYRHGLDPEIGSPVGGVFPDDLQKAQGLIGAASHTGIGGFADLRNAFAATHAHTPFDEFFHFADPRRGRGALGWHNIPRLGVFLWRLKSFAIQKVTPVKVAGCADDQYSFDPTGRQIPLFAAGGRTRETSFGDHWTSPEEWQLKTPISRGLLKAVPDRLYPASMAVIRKLTGDVLPLSGLTILPDLGRFKGAGLSQGSVVASYHYGFSAPVGAGPYDRFPGATVPLQPETAVTGGGAITLTTPSGTTTIGDSLTYTATAGVNGIGQAMLRAATKQRPLVRLAAGFEWVFTGNAGASLTLDGVFISGGDIVLKGDFDVVTLRQCTFDPGSADVEPNVFQKSVDNRDLSPTRIWVEGAVGELRVESSILGPVRTRNGGVLTALTVSGSVLQAIRTSGFGNFTPAVIKDPKRLALRLRDARDPLAAFLKGQLAAADQATLAAYDGKQLPSAALLAVIIAVLNGQLSAAAFFTPARFGPVKLSASTLALLASNPTGAMLTRLNRLLIEEAFPLELADAAIASADSDVTLDHCTVLGRAWVHHLDASECILNDLILVEDPQHGCVRFSAWSNGSILPRQYESVAKDPQAPLFTSRVFGNPAYCQLLPSAGSAILEGSQDGSEMGVFAREKNAIKQRGLLAKYDEFMPLGLVPVVVYVT